MQWRPRRGRREGPCATRLPLTLLYLYLSKARAHVSFIFIVTHAVLSPLVDEGIGVQ